MLSDPLLLCCHLASCHAHNHQIYNTITPPSAEATLVMQSKDVAISSLNQSMRGGLLFFGTLACGWGLALVLLLSAV